jgi:hypothetical protein
VPTPSEISAKERIVQPGMAEATWFIKSRTLEQCVTGRYISVSLPQSFTPMTFTADAVYSLVPGNYYWSGYNLNGSNLHIQRMPEGVMATIWNAPENRYYGIGTLSPETDLLIKYNPSFLPVGDVCGIDEEEENQSMPPGPGNCTLLENDIRVLFLFSPAAASRLGTFRAASLSNQVIGELNSASIASGITPAQASFTLAGIAGLTGFTEDPCSSKTQEALLKNAEAKELEKYFFRRCSMPDCQRCTPAISSLRCFRECNKQCK